MGVKARIRAWLIDLVREALSSELKRISAQLAGIDAQLLKHLKTPDVRLKLGHAAAQLIVSEPSFEQMQAESLKEQAEFYEVKK